MLACVPRPAAAGCACSPLLLGMVGMCPVKHWVQLGQWAGLQWGRGRGGGFDPPLGGISAPAGAGFGVRFRGGWVCLPAPAARDGWYVSWEGHGLLDVPCRLCRERGRVVLAGCRM